jgi:Protein of unknown function (DUF3761)
MRGCSAACGSKSRAALAALAVYAVLAVLAGPAGATAPTARCRDGTLSYSAHHSGTCSHHGGVANWLDGGSVGALAPGGSKTSEAPAVALGATVQLGPRTKTAGCRLGPRPDARCSPGAYSTGLTKAVICSPGYRTSAVRNVPESEKHAVEIEYGLPPSSYGSTLEIDHIVPLDLGGSNAIANLFPERAAAAPGYHVKDRLEDRLPKLVCAGRMTLRTTQREIASNWEHLYRQVFGSAPGV